MNIKTLEESTKIIDSIKSLPHLQNIMLIFLEKVQRSKELTQQNQFHLRFLIDKILSKIFELVPDTSTNSCIQDFIRILDELRIFTYAQKVAIQQYCNYIFNWDTDTSYTFSEYQDQIEQEFQENLDKLINVKRLNNGVKFGYAICDLQGNIMWLCQNCEKIIEVGRKRVANINLFNLMIPFSQNKLKRQFLKNNEDIIEIFNPMNLLDPAIFSFVIYSDKKFQKFQRIIKLKIQKQREIDNIYKNEGNSLYHKFLKTVSCKASLINLTFTPQELKEIDKNKQMFFKLTQCFIDNQIGDFKELNEIQIQQQANKFQSLAVFVKFRESKKIPNFDYSLLENDERILQYKYMIKSKIQSQQLIND